MARCLSGPYMRLAMASESGKTPREQEPHSDGLQVLGAHVRLVCGKDQLTLLPRSADRRAPRLTSVLVRHLGRAGHRGISSIRAGAQLTDWGRALLPLCRRPSRGARARRRRSAA